MLKGRIMPFYVLLRMSTEAQAVPEGETYAGSCVKKSTAKLIQKQDKRMNEQFVNKSAFMSIF